jgi:hypothetical protein
LAYDELNLIDDLVLIRPCLEHAAAEGNGIGRRLIEGLDRSADIERRYTVVASNHFVASHPPGAAYEQVIGEILAALEAARADIEAPLGLATRRLVPVVIYDFGEFGAATAAPHWAAARYDGKIRIPVEVLDRSSASIAQVLTHEYAHALFHELADRRLPVWFNEGLASLLAGKRSRLDVLDRAAAEGNLLGVLDLSRSFARLPVAEAEIAYAQSLAIVSDLVDEVGWLGVRGLLLHLRARRFGGFEPAFATLFGEPPDSYLERWSATVSPAAVLPR